MLSNKKKTTYYNQHVYFCNKKNYFILIRVVKKYSRILPRNYQISVWQQWDQKDPNLMSQLESWAPMVMLLLNMCQQVYIQNKFLNYFFNKFCLIKFKILDIHIE